MDNVTISVNCEYFSLASRAFFSSSTAESKTAGGISNAGTGQRIARAMVEDFSHRKKKKNSNYGVGLSTSTVQNNSAVIITESISL